MFGTDRPHLGSSTVGIFVVVLFSSLCVLVHLLCVATEARGQCWVSLPIALRLSCFETGSLVGLGLTLGSSAVMGAPGIPLSLLPGTEVEATSCHVQHV